MVISASELCSVCRKIPSWNGMPLEAMINAIHSNREKFIQTDDELNAMIFSYLFEYQDIWRCPKCWPLILDCIPLSMRRSR